MSLGLNSIGFELSFANELSPMASETFAFNHLNVNLKDQCTSNRAVKWLTSKFAKDQIDKRLEENPQEYPGWSLRSLSDVSQHGINGDGELVVGSIVSLNQYLESDLENQRASRNALDVDLISGGPPCQSFSMAGLRQLENHRNRLPWEFARFVNLVRPKIALLENVSGILRAFKQDGQEYLAWKEVAKAFVEVGYAPLCLHVNAKFVGVPQNRPRFLMFAIRKDFAESLSLEGPQRSILEQAIASMVPDFDWDEFRYWDVSNPRDSQFFAAGPFRHLFTHSNSNQFISVGEAISDLSSGLEIGPSRYVEQLNGTFPSQSTEVALPRNSETRHHGFRVQQRFRLYQVLEELGERHLARRIAVGLRTGKTGLVQDLARLLMDKEFLFEPGALLRKPASTDEIGKLISSLVTKKHSQRALVEKRPAPAALSIPDDCCHYSRHELRTLTVREMARIQSFPDWFEFRSKATTGGVRRKFEVPQYTQVGNAVPPLLARQAGKVVLELLDSYSKKPEKLHSDMVGPLVEAQ